MYPVVDVKKHSKYLIFFLFFLYEKIPYITNTITRF